MSQPEKSSYEDRTNAGPSREGIESFLVVLGLFLAALVWFWITLSRG
jgi:hypothetical protein